MADGPAEGYTGYRLAAPGDAIERIDAGSVDAASFFATYVAARKPVVLCGQPSGGDQENAESAEAREARVRNLVEAVLGAGARCWEWTNENLRQKAGDARVKVEYRSAESGSFGLGRKASKTFGEVLTAMEGGATSYYMTTQELPIDTVTGFVGLVGPPLDRLGDDFPVRPAIVPTLVPQQVNVWIGNTKSGSSTGLHHDYHDNLYVLVRGRKRFFLAAPSEAPRLYPHGTLDRIHANGRINYAGRPSRADGLEPDSPVAAWHARFKVEEELRMATASNDARRIARAEQALEGTWLARRFKCDRCS